MALPSSLGGRLRPFRSFHHLLPLSLPAPGWRPLSKPGQPTRPTPWKRLEGPRRMDPPTPPPRERGPDPPRCQGTGGLYRPYPAPWHPRRSHLLVRNVHHAGPTRSPGELEVRLCPRVGGGGGVGGPLCWSPAAPPERPRLALCVQAAPDSRGAPHAVPGGEMRPEPCELPLPGGRRARGAFCPSTIPRAKDEGGGTPPGADIHLQLF